MTLKLQLDRSNRTPLSEQIRAGIAAAIHNGVLAPGVRLPSWIDLATQLGVSRGTVKAAYERLTDAQLVTPLGAGGTRVALHPPRQTKSASTTGARLYSLMYPVPESGPNPIVFRMGVPGMDCLPAALLARLQAKAAREVGREPALYPAAQGEIELRREVAAHLALARGIDCLPEQVIITTGFTGALGLALHALQIKNRDVWVENPGFPPSRKALRTSGFKLIPISVDDQGLDVDLGIQQAPEASLVLTTPSQQAPTGAILSLSRRLKLLEWAQQSGAWIIEDDYLGELQLKRRAAPALASLDQAGRVIHIGSFSKTISPTLRLGFLVVPLPLLERFATTANCLGPAPTPVMQLAISRFMSEGHYMRHLRRTKRLYTYRAEALRLELERLGLETKLAGLALLLKLPESANDQEIARQAYLIGLAPAALSMWSFDLEEKSQNGLLLGVSNIENSKLKPLCETLKKLIEESC
ncbi:MocR-like pyridoxine biosynthesis transcription factor PdxR [Pseudomonas aeruginosa]|uniref:MocR-like pyridoxine biosynthesis transcription factor PdxR n=1 Tax=Pseudomonas aeruginosa TaxID=287 RepID=UPI0034D35B47